MSHAVFFAKPKKVGLFFECSFTKKTLKGDLGWCLVIKPEFCWEDLVC